MEWFAPSAEVDLCGHATLAGKKRCLIIISEKNEIVFYLQRAWQVIS